MKFPVYFIILSLSSCTLFSTQRTVTVEVPSLPEDLSACGTGVWSLVMSSTSGTLRQERLEWTLPLPERIRLEWPKEEDLLILMMPPEWAEGIGPSPCGAYVSPDEGSGSLSWQDGAAVSILTRILQAGGNLYGFNCSRFLGEMAALDNPWTADRDLLIRQLGRREMRSWYIRKAALFQVALTLPAGRWFSQYLAAEPLESGGGSLELKLPEGYACFYNPGLDCVAEIQVDDHGEVFILLR